jgi:hypothetical protein
MPLVGSHLDQTLHPRVNPDSRSNPKRKYIVHGKMNTWRIIWWGVGSTTYILIHTSIHTSIHPYIHTHTYIYIHTLELMSCG